MFKNFLFALVLSAVSLFQTDAQEYRNVHQEKLENGLSIVTIEANSSDMLLVMFCVSCGSTDEIEKEGIANLLAKIYSKKLNNNGESLHYGAEINSYVGYDQSIYYILAQTNNLEDILKNFGEIYRNFSVSENEAKSSKKEIEKSLINKSQIDKNVIQRESRRSMYWHSKYGSDIEGTLDSLRQISEKDIKRFKDNNYTNNRITIIVSGNINKDKVRDCVKQYFSDTSSKKEETKSVITRLQEPPHHNSTISITKYSNQINVPMIEMYWKIPNYRNEKENALATEIFINAVSDILQKNIVENSENVESISVSYSLWNYDYGDLCVTLTAKDQKCISDVITATLTEIKNIAYEGITKDQAEQSLKKILDANRFIGHDMFEVAEDISKKISAGYDFDFIVGYPKFVKKYNLEKINEQAKEIFKKDPCVISTIIPERKNIR